MVNNKENTMSDKHALQLILEALRREGEELRVRTYSGRYMYNSECLGVSIERLDTYELVAKIVERTALKGAAQAETKGGFASDHVQAALVPVMQALSHTEVDSLGMGKIVYWPNVPFVGEEEDA
jgi:hypothetical protein